MLLFADSVCATTAGIILMYWYVFWCI